MSRGKKGSTKAAPDIREDQADVKRQTNGQFAPGHSGNPGGRPAVARKIQQLAAQHVDDVVNQLWDMAQNATSESVRMAAMKEILDRAGGRSTQPHDGANMSVTVLIDEPEPEE